MLPVPKWGHSKCHSQVATQPQVDVESSFFRDLVIRDLGVVPVRYVSAGLAGHPRPFTLGVIAVRERDICQSKVGY